ncbi:MAG TPA: hypothetical protein VFB76_05260 [Candidatus Angelobacter sp.]|nr:hypothetical protein [Candidatus Angelobacter sp.]
MPKVLALGVRGPDRAFSYPHFLAGVNYALRKIQLERLEDWLEIGNRFGRSQGI